MAKSWNRNLLVEVAKLRYERNLSSDQIATQKNLSRATVNRMLYEAQESGIFSLQVVVDNESEIGLRKNEADDLLKKLQHRYPHLNAIHLVAGDDRCDDKEIGHHYRNDVLRIVASTTARIFSNFLQASPQSSVVVGPGELMKLVISSVKIPQSMPGLKILPIVGYQSPQFTEVSANLIGHLLAQRTGGHFFWMPVVSMVDPKDEAAVKRSPIVRDAVKELEDLVKRTACQDPPLTTHSIVMVSIGSVDARRLNQFVKNQTFLSREQLKQYVLSVRKNRPIGMIGSWMFSATGEIITHPLSNVGLPLDAMRSMVNTKKGKVVLVVGAANRMRVRALHAALLGCFGNILITDHITAKKLLKIH